MVDIPAEATSWPNPDQYIQDAIDGEPAGTTFLLKAGVHRMQTIELRTGDTLNFEAGAILRGSQDISGLTWTKDGVNARWYCTLTDLNASSGGTFRTGYARWREWPILDDNPCPFMDTVGDVDPDTAYYDSVADRLYIGIDPATLTTIELARQQIAIQAVVGATGVTIKGDRYQPNVIENYASGEQSENAGLKIGRRGDDTITNANWTFQDFEVRNFRGLALAHGDYTLISRVDFHHSGQIGTGGTRTDGGVVEYCSFHANAIGGWSSGWEAGNTKYAFVDDHTSKGSWFDSAYLKAANPLTPHPHMATTGPIWYDIDNDDCYIFGNHILDRTNNGYRGLFWEVSYGVHIYNNICYKLAWNAESPGWTQGIIFSTAGPYAGSTIYPALVYDNIMYECSGGLKVQGAHRGDGDQGEYLGQNIECDGNVIQITDSANIINFSDPGVHGTDIQAGQGGGGHNYSKNLYVAPSLNGSHWRKDVDDGDGDGYGADDFARWKSEIESDAVAFTRDLTNPKVDFNPYRGGAM